MATDAGFDMIVPYSDVDLKEVAGLVQDAIFSRAPQDGRHTAVLIGGREPLLAIDMLEAAKHAMVPPHFQISVMADPSGAFTTAAGMIAVVEKHSARQRRRPVAAAASRCSAAPGRSARSRR